MGSLHNLRYTGMYMHSSTLTGDQSNNFHWIKHVSDVQLTIKF